MNSVEQTMSITRGSRDLVNPPTTPEGKLWYYGMAVPFQVAPERAALMCNIREAAPRGQTHVDFEIGTDVVLLDDLSRITADNAIPIVRNHEEVNPQVGEPSIMAKYPVIVGFVPCGAKRQDGTPHPHAGSGFGMCHAVSWPREPKIRHPQGYYLPYQNQQSYSFVEVYQFSYHGGEFVVAANERISDPGQWLDGYRLGFCGLTPPLPDGDDFLMPMTGTRANKTNGEQDLHLGITRWKRDASGWHPTDFRTVANPTIHSEMSLVREPNGSLLYMARGDDALSCLDFQLWRSNDDGETWEESLKVKWVRSAAPVSINLAANGRPYILANLLHVPFIGTGDPLQAPHAGGGWRYLGGIRRDKLFAWPLSETGDSLETPVMVRDCEIDFGPPPGGTMWNADHAMAKTLRLSDGQWHNLLTYRVLELGENGLSCAPTQYTGCYIEEVLSSGPARPDWNF